MGVSVGQEGPHYRATDSLYGGAAASETPGTTCMCNHVHFDSSMKTEHVKRSGGCRTFLLLPTSSPLVSRPLSHELLSLHRHGDTLLATEAAQWVQLSGK